MTQNEETSPQRAPGIAAAVAPAIDRRVELAAFRTILALDRTLLAWVRTAISLMAGGIAFDKGAVLLHETRMRAGTAIMRSSHAVGIGVTLVSTALTVLQILIYLRCSHEVTEIHPRPRWMSPALIAAVQVVILGLLGTLVLIATGG